VLDLEGNLIDTLLHVFIRKQSEQAMSFFFHSKRLTKEFFGVILCVSMLLALMPTASANVKTRSIIDRPDEISGFQVHLVYVVAKGSRDSGWDTNGKIESWVIEANNWLNKQVDRKLIFDTFEGKPDITFLQSQYRAVELCRRDCEALDKLEAEFLSQQISYKSSKTIVFVLDENLATSNCGWAESPGVVSLIHLGDPGCSSSSRERYGLSWPAKSILHELFHTFGVGHQCFDNTDLMIGSPECPKSRAEKPITLDLKRNKYVGSEVSDGIDLLKMPIWTNGSGSTSYTKIKQTSNEKYLPQLEDDKVYAVIGQKSEYFAWAWEKDLNPIGSGFTCQFISGATYIEGEFKGSSCYFDVPSTLRAGKAFTVTQKWNKGPWSGEASATGVLVRSDFSSELCSTYVCFEGGTSTAKYSCWDSSIKNLTLQELIAGKWTDIKTVQTVSGERCLNGGKSSFYPDAQLSFKQTGLFIYRWFLPAQSGFRSASDNPFAVVVNNENSSEPSAVLTKVAQTQAIELGKAADLAKSAGTKAALDSVIAQQTAASKAISDLLASELRSAQENDSRIAAELLAKQEAIARAAAELIAKLEAEAKAAALKKTTITCVKGKLTKKVTAVKPQCPSGYKKK
jgi:hypothetical protein